MICVGPIRAMPAEEESIVSGTGGMAKPPRAMCFPLAQLREWKHRPASGHMNASGQVEIFVEGVRERSSK